MTNDDLNYENQLNKLRQLWNAEAASFDNEPDHGLRDPDVLAAWITLLKESIPTGKHTVLDIGCGTGSLSVLLAGLGYKITGIDFSPDMIALAEKKAALFGYDITFLNMDGAYPKFDLDQFDVIVCRHLLWALQNPDQVLRRWANLLKPHGRLVLIEGFWHTGAGLHAQDVIRAMPESITNILVRNLSDHTALWGRSVNDERYLITADYRG
jgi:2-polyprenyl-3-methyl-5-hydroxy-6-metoxy-1,4-benzoquinol methylase